MIGMRFTHMKLLWFRGSFLPLAWINNLTCKSSWSYGTSLLAWRSVMLNPWICRYIKVLVNLTHLWILSFKIDLLPTATTMDLELLLHIKKNMVSLICRETSIQFFFISKRYIKQKSTRDTPTHYIKTHITSVLAMV